MLTSRGILVKVNSVMIPGVNDEHLKEVSRVVKAKGAFLHNVMPLIAEAEHGTYYGIMEQRGPTDAELQSLQDECAGDMSMMRHCRQCRADAVGLLGEDRGDEFTMDKIDVMDVDYEAAMVRRRSPRLDHREAGRQARHRSSQGRRHSGRLRPVLMAVAGKNGVVAEHFGHAKGIPHLRSFPAGALHQPPQDRALLRRRGYLRRRRRGTGFPPRPQHQGPRRLRGRPLLKIGYEPWGKLEAAGIAPNGEHAMEPIEDAVMAVLRNRGHRQATAASRFCPEGGVNGSPDHSNPASIAGPVSMSAPTTRSTTTAHTS